MNIVKSILYFLTGFTKNGNKDHSVAECKDLFKKAKKSIHVVAGDLESHVFENPDILEILKKRTTREDNPIQVQILYGPKADPKTVSIFELSKSNPNIKLFQLSKRANGHFVVVDNKHTRVEEYHEPFTSERKAYTTWNTLFLADELENEFYGLKSHAKEPVVSK